MQIQILASAEQDLLDGYHFYERQQASLGSYFLDSLYSDIDSLVLYAGIHPLYYGHFHRLLSKRFPFAIYYDLTENLITIIAVLGCRKNPDSISKKLG